MACFSLNATKNLSGGEGGFVNTDNEQYWERAKMIRTFGEKVLEEKEKIRPYYSFTIGWNYRTQELPAAFARSQLKRLPRYNANAQRNGQYLSRELSKISGLLPPYVPDDRTTIRMDRDVRCAYGRKSIGAAGWLGSRWSTSVTTPTTCIRWPLTST